MYFIIRHAYLLVLIWLTLCLVTTYWWIYVRTRPRATITVLSDYRPGAVQSARFLRDRKGSVPWWTCAIIAISTASGGYYQYYQHSKLVARYAEAEATAAYFHPELSDKQVDKWVDQIDEK